MIQYNSVADFLDKYDGFILDIWGVIHDGESLYPNVLASLEEMKLKNKQVVFLSNAPRRSHKVKMALAKFGIAENLYFDAVSSGEVAYNLIPKADYFYIGPEKDADLLDGNKTLAHKAAYAVTTGFDNDNSTLEEKIPQIQQALAAKLKLYCVNPDLIVVRQNGTKMLCAGVIGNYYQECGGEVEFIGKPYKQVYDFVLSKFTSKNIAAIGDGLETDILGANNLQIDSILVLGGILQAENKPIEQIMQEKGIFPTATTQQFAI